MERNRSNGRIPRFFGSVRGRLAALMLGLAGLVIPVAVPASANAPGAMLPFQGPNPGAPPTYVQWTSGLRGVFMGTGQQIWNEIVVSHINPLQSGDQLRINMYGMVEDSTTRFVFDAIRSAIGRGVTVYVISDAQKSPSIVLPGATIRHCTLGCDYTGTSSKAKNHSKVLLITKPNGDRTLIQGSMNIVAGTFDDFEAATYVDGTHYTAVWDEFWRQYSIDWCRAGGGSCQSTYSEQVFNGYVSAFIPGPTSSYNQLDSAFFEGMTYYPGCALRIAVGHVGSSTSVSRPIFQELRRISDDGCKVDLIYGGTYRSWIHQEPYCEGSGGSVGVFECEHQPNVHLKMFLWQGMWDHDNNSSTASVLDAVTFIGSTNLTYNALRRNDEHHIAIRTNTEFEAAWDYFQYIEYSG